MTVYAVANLTDVNVGPDIVQYLEKIDATLAPFGGKFIIHGGDKTVLEGHWNGDLIVIAFPDRESVDGWYASSAYQAILPLRTKNSVGNTMIVDGVDASHKA